MYGLRGYGFGAVPPPAIQSALQTASQQYGVPYSLLASVAHAESGFNPAATSSAGAQGLMQIMPGNDASLGVTNPFDPNQSAAAGAKFLSQLYSQYGDWNTALIAYNEGPGNLASKGVFPSSQSYADGILADQVNYGGPIPSGPSDTGTVDPSTGLPVDSSTVVDASQGGLSTGAYIGLAAAAAGLLLWAAS